MFHLISDLAGVAAFIACYLYALGEEPLLPHDDGGPRGGHPVDLRPALSWM